MPRKIHGSTAKAAAEMVRLDGLEVQCDKFGALQDIICPFGRTYSIGKVAKILHVGRKRVESWATREEDPMPFLVLPGSGRGAFVTHADLVDWLARNLAPYRGGGEVRRR